MVLSLSAALVRRGLAAPLEDCGGLDVRMVDMGSGSLDAMAEYLTKITAEVTAAVAKDARDGSRSPFAVLRDALATGLAEDSKLWIEWERASSNRKQVTWSRGLREWAGLHRERTDDQIVEEDRHGEDVAAIHPEDWPRLPGSPRRAARGRRARRHRRCARGWMRTESGGNPRIVSGSDIEQR